MFEAAGEWRRKAHLLFRGIFFFLATSAIAQDVSPSPLPSPVPLPSATPVASPTPAVVLTPTATPTPSLLKKTGVKIQFIPPPMQGTISLGIYDHTGKLVRVLHREAGSDEFVAALDGYITHWDGLDDASHPAPPGHYSARGYMVGTVTVQTVPTPAASLTGSNATPAQTPPLPVTPDSAPPTLTFPDGKPFAAQDNVHTLLVSNPLERDRAGAADVCAHIDATGSWLDLSDGLPLKQISATPNLKWIAMGRSAPGQPLMVFQSDGATVEEFLITKVSDMMAFDCGGFDFTGPSN